ncbi:MAG: MerR family transcriptional regulator [Kineosporiaceae bacterium]
MDGDGYTIEQVSALTGITRHTLRYYERIGILAPVERASSGHRRYTDDDLGALRFVTLLRETGMPVRDMQRFMELTRSGEHTVPDRVALLREHRDAVRARLERETAHLHAIEIKVGIYEGLLDAEGGAPLPAPADRIGV